MTTTRSSMGPTPVGSGFAAYPSLIQRRIDSVVVMSSEPALDLLGAIIVLGMLGGLGLLRSPTIDRGHDSR